MATTRNLAFLLRWKISDYWGPWPRAPWIRHWLWYWLYLK